MLILTVICFFAGAILGFRFKVFILVPPIGLALAVVVLNGVAVEEGALRLVGKMVVVAASVQLGYVLGVILQFVTHSTDSADRRGISMPSSTEGSQSGRLRNSG